MRFPSLILGACLASALGCGPRAAQTGVPVIATLDGREVELVGVYFGDPAPSVGLRIVSANGIVTLDSTGPAVSLWTDGLIRFTPPAGTPSGVLEVTTAGGTAALAPLEIYAYDDFPVPAAAGLPLAVAASSDGLIYVNGEFHTDVAVVNPALGTSQVLGLPHPDGGPFAQQIDGDSSTQLSELAEDVTIDDDGVVWFTEGGALLYTGGQPNHSRVVAYDPRDAGFRVYNVPGDDNEVIGVAWDRARGRIWFAEGGQSSGSKLASFDPLAVPFDNAFDFSTSLDDEVNPADGGGYQLYDAGSASGVAAHVLVDDDGAIWFTEFLGNAVDRLVPSSGVVQRLPLPPPDPSTSATQQYGRGPWTIDRVDGGVIFDEYFEEALGVVDLARVRAGDAACLALGVDGNNPCISDIAIPGADPSIENVHSTVVDATGRVWFSLPSLEEPDAGAAIGFVTADLSYAVRLPQLPIDAGESMIQPNGLTIDPTTQDLWFAEYQRHAVGRLHKQ